MEANWCSEAFTRSTAMRSLLSLVKDKVRFGVAAGMVTVVVVHAADDVDHPITPASSETATHAGSQVAG